MAIIAPPRSATLARLRSVCERWSLRPLVALRCTPALAIALATGLVGGYRAAGAIACGAALTVGFGVYQDFARSQLGPMVAATLGMCLATLIGTVAGLSTAAMLPVTALAGFWCGLLPAMGGGSLWIGQQCTIFLLVAGSFPANGGLGLARAGLVLAGGTLQIIVVETLVSLADVRRELSGWAQTRAEIGEGLRNLRAGLHPGSEHFRFAIRVAVALCAGEFIARQFAFPNGYWIGMTTVLLLRIDFHDTWRRSLARIGGTVAGVLLATLLLAWLRPAPAATAAMAVAFGMLAFAFLRTHYGVFSAWVTAYIVCLLVFAGLTEPTVARYRIVGTAIGAALALAAHLHFRLGWPGRRPLRDT